MKLIPFIFALLLIFFTGSCSPEHQYRKFKGTFEKDIQKLEKLTDDTDKKYYLLFIGSSSIRRWNTVEEDMSPYSVLKRG